MEQKTCKYCGFAVSDNFYFCPNCGKKLIEPPLSTSIGKQIGIYALSFFLPPLGLVPGFRYLRQKDSKSKIVGLIAILLTLVSIIITIKLALNLVTYPLGLESVNQMQQLQNLGY